MTQQKDDLDRFYTKETVAADVYKTFVRVLNDHYNQIDVFIEPSAGSGAFYKLLPPDKRRGYDLAPACEGVIQQDFYTTDDSRLDAACIAYIGNPPFGRQTRDAMHFFNHCAANPNARYIAFVVPKSFQKSSVQDGLDASFWLVYDEELPAHAFLRENASYNVPCCFQIWQRMSVKRKEFVVPKNIWFELLTKEEALDYRSKGGDVVALRRVGGKSGESLEGLDHTESTTYFVRLFQPWVRTFLHERHWDLYNTRTVGVKSISIPEILRELEHVATSPVSRGVQTPQREVPAKIMNLQGWDIKIWNEDCVQGAARLPDACIDLLICDPPFGSCEPRFEPHAYRDDITVVAGYVAVPENYSQFSKAWLEQAYRVLQPHGSLYVVSGWLNAHLIQQALLDVGFHVMDKIIWKHPFRFDLKQQFVNTHCEIFYCSKSANAQPYFARQSRFYDSDKAEFGLRFHPNSRDRESVWSIKDSSHSGEKRTPGKLPDTLVAKMLAYSSHVDHLVCDFFLGYGTTALVARSLGNRVCGFEIDPEAYRYIGEQLNDTERYAKAIRARKTNDRQAFEADLSRYLPDVAQH